jgi:hypothetical protein
MKIIRSHPKTIAIALGIATLCALLFGIWLAVNELPAAKFSSGVLMVGKGTNGTISAWCGLENPGRRGITVACDYYEIKTPAGWRPRDEYDLGTWYVPPRGSRTVVLPAPSVTNHWRVVWRYNFARTNYNPAERWAEDGCVTKLHRWSPLTPPRFAYSSEIE